MFMTITNKRFMIFRCLGMTLVLGCSLLVTTTAMADGKLRVCADPDNLPFSNRKQQGFENKIAMVLAKDMKASLSYTWMKQRQNFFRQTLGAQRCDVVIGVPTHFDRVLTTRPYYRSSYVFITRRRQNLVINTYDDQALKDLKIGIHAIGNDGGNSPPAVILGRHGLAKNIIGYSMWGESSVKNPQGLIVSAVAEGEIDAAIVWGPIGGYFAKQYAADLTVSPAPADLEMTIMPFEYDISMGVRKGETELAERLEKSIGQNRQKIKKILSNYHIPVIKPDSNLSTNHTNYGLSLAF
jgi:quinoprotein dehydrogenase-associated probable ABC transporter substrate-binding protein